MALAHGSRVNSPTLATTPRMTDKGNGTGSRPASRLGSRVQFSLPEDPDALKRPYQDFVKTWDDDKVAQWLSDIGVGQLQDTFKRNDIRGHVLLDVDQTALKEMGVRSVGDRVKITVAIKALRNKCASPASPFAARFANNGVGSRSTSPSLPSDAAGSVSASTLTNTSLMNVPVRRPSARVPPPPLHLSRSNSIATAESSQAFQPGSTATSFRTHSASQSLSFGSSSTSFSAATTPTSAVTPRLVASASTSPASRNATHLYSTSPPRATLTNLKSAPHILTTAASPTNSYTGSIGGSSGTSLNQLRNKSSSPSPGERLRSPPSGTVPSRPTTMNAVTGSGSLAHRKSPSMATGNGGVGVSIRPLASSSDSLSTHPYAAANSPTQDAFTVTTYGRGSPGGGNSSASTLQSRLLPSPSIANSTSTSSTNATTLSPSSSAQSLDDVLRKTTKFVGDDGVSKLIAVADCKDGHDVLARVVKKFTNSPGEDDLEQWGVFTLAADGSVSRLINEAELFAICRDSSSQDRQRGLAVRRLPQDKRGRKLQWVFGDADAAREVAASTNTPASPNYLGIEIPTTFVEPASPSSSSTHSNDLPFRDNNVNLNSAVGNNSNRTERAKRNRASVVSVMSGLGGADWSTDNLSLSADQSYDSYDQSTTLNASGSNNTSNNNNSSGRKLRNFFGQRPPSELIATHLMEYFPRAERSKLLSKSVRQSLRRSMMRRDSQSSGVALSGPTSWDSNTAMDGNDAISLKSNGPMRTSGGIGGKSSAPPSILESMYEEAVDGQPSQDDFTTDSRSVTSSKFTRRSASQKRKSGASRASLWDKRSKDSDSASIVTVDEVTAELENRRASWATAGVGANGESASSDDEDGLYRSSSELSTESVLLDEGDETYDTDESEGEQDEVETGAAGKPALKWVRGALIGAGSFGSVFLAMNTSSGSLMAVKQVELPTGNSHNEEKKKAMLDALQHEIELLKTLQHENIVQYLDSASDGQHLNIFLEYVPGGSVAALLSNYGAFEEALVSKFVRQILTGLEYLHEREIIHRDIKGANILVDNKGGIKISDFGISKRVEDNLLTGSKVHRPSLQGSVYWMAPEVVKQTAYTSKADIWSLGCLVVEMLTGTHPWANLTQMQAIFRIGQSAIPTIPDDISSDAEDFLDQTFLVDHDARPGATGLLKHAFVSAEGEAGMSTVTSAPVSTAVAASMQFDVSQQTPTRATFATSAAS
ncbi:ATP binding [Microbotryomycetes sp. JL221]|nr:ATP binding [Microbotryomycetes sp. JL221]